MASGTGNEAQERLFLTTYHMWGSSPDFSLILPSPYELGGLWHGFAFPLDSELTNSPKQECALLPVLFFSASSLLWSKRRLRKRKEAMLISSFSLSLCSKVQLQIPKRNLAGCAPFLVALGQV